MDSGVASRRSFLRRMAVSAVSARPSTLAQLHEEISAVKATIATLELRNQYDVRKFGAVGDGITDDTAAIQRAQDAGGCYFPGGHTFLASEILFDTGRVFFGDGHPSVIRMKDRAADLTTLATFTGLFKPRTNLTAYTDNCSWQGLRLLGNSAGQHAGGGPMVNANDTRHGIRLNACRHCTIEDVWAEDFDGDGIYLGQVVAGAPFPSLFNRVERCVVKNNVRNGMMIGAGSYNTIQHNLFESNQVGMNLASPKYAPPMYQSAELDIEPNHINEAANYNRIIGNTFLNGWNVGIQSTRPGYNSGGVKGNIFRDNVFKDCRKANVICITEVFTHNLFQGNVSIITDPAATQLHLRISRGSYNRIETNTFIGGGNGAGTGRSVQIDTGGGTFIPTGNVLRNNLFDFAGASGDGLAVFIEAPCVGSIVEGNQYLGGAYPDLRPADLHV